MMGDLDAPRYAIPCLGADGQPTGRILACPDRARVLVGGCAGGYDPHECAHCLPGTAAMKFLPTLCDVTACTGCHAVSGPGYPPHHSYELVFLDGNLGGIPPLVAPTEHDCNWAIDYALVRWRKYLFGDVPGDCAGEWSYEDEFQLRAVLSVVRSEFGYDVHFEIQGSEYGAPRPLCWFKGTTRYKETPDCQDLLVYNELPPACYSYGHYDCEYGHGGYATFRGVR